MEKEQICTNCNMLFHSARLLEKHKAMFCIGSEVEHLQVQRRSSEPLRRDKAGALDPRQTRTPDLVQGRNISDGWLPAEDPAAGTGGGASSRNAAQLRGQQRNISRWRRDVDAEPKSQRAEEKAASSQTDGHALQHLTDEFHKLRMSIEENLPVWSKRTTEAEASGRQLGHGERLKEMREMATLHERQLALIHARNQQLEQQRDELAHQVSILSEQSNTTPLQSLLMELREQEERNEETLQQLAEHLRALQVHKGSVAADRPDPQTKEKFHHNFELISSADGPLSTQIKALRQAYIHSGGSDPAIVAQMIDLQAEAQSLERNPPAAAAKPRKKKVKPAQTGVSWELRVLEQENQRLEEEIFRVQLARERHHDYEAGAKTELDLIKRENLHQTASLQAEMERKKEGSRPRRQPPPPPPPPPLQTKTHIQAPLSLLQTRSFSSQLGGYVIETRDSLGPAPYDPAAGFVVFYDLVLGVDASQNLLRLVSALYSNGQEVGPPAPLPPVQCLPGVSLPYPLNLTPGNSVHVSVKQPVPGIQPSSSLSLVVEVQTARDVDVYNHEVFKLESCGWMQLELFDEYNQLRSGHWRVPVRSLPIRPSTSIAQLNSIPQVGNMELWVRLVNGRDGDVQTLVKPNHWGSGHYKYPAAVPSLPAIIQGNAAVPVSASQPTGVDKLSSPLPITDHKDPSPTDEASAENKSTLML